MKPEHAFLLRKIKEYLSLPDAHKLRFGQALFNLNILQVTPVERGSVIAVDIHSHDDQDIIKRLNLDYESRPEDPGRER